MTTTDENLADAIKLNTAKEINEALHEFVGAGAMGLKKAKKAGRPLFILPNWKFQLEDTAIQFFAVSLALLEKKTKETFYSCRLDTGHEGHLMLAIGWGMKESEFREHMAEMNECKTCDHCGKETDLNKCGGCGTKYYCGKDCQKAAWKGHKESCQNKSKLYKSVSLAIE
jgi:hypothetical protein